MSRAPAVLVTGATGWIGRALVASLRADGREVRTLGRRPGGAGEFGWDPVAGRIDEAAFEGVETIFHLAGESIASGRWSEARKQRIRQSRIDGTRLVARAATGRSPTATLVSASAIGFYGDAGEALCDEQSPAGGDFLAKVCRDWESEAATAGVARVVTPRIGVVLGPGGGALERLIPLFKAGLGGRLGSGRQWMSWLSLRDAVAALRHCAATDSLSGPVNLSSPNPVRNAEFTAALGTAVSRPAILPVPAFALRLAMGELADLALLGGQRVVPARLGATGFAFTDPTIDRALAWSLSAASRGA